MDQCKKEEKKLISWILKGITSKIFLALVFLFLFCAQVKNASAASIYFSPNSGSYEVGKTFSVGVFVSSADEAMNAASGGIFFPADKLEVTSLSKSGSIFSLWAQEPAFSNKSGTISFEGIVMNPGYKGSSGKLLAITFRVKAEGQASLNFSSGSVLANDGLGSSILNGLGSAKLNFTKKPEETKPEPVVPQNPVESQAEPTPEVDNPEEAVPVTPVVEPGEEKIIVPDSPVVDEYLPSQRIDRDLPESPDFDIASVARDNRSSNYVGWQMIRLLLILLVSLLALLLLAVIFIFGPRKLKDIRSRLALISGASPKDLSREIRRTREDIEKRIAILERNRMRRALVDRAERKIMQKLKEELEDLDTSFVVAKKRRRY